MKLLTKLLIKGGAVAPTTAQYLWSAVSAGISGQLDTTSVAGRARVTAALGTADVSILTVWVKGTSASCWMYHSSGSYTDVAGLLECSVDDGAFTVPTPVAAKFPLFSGLSDTTHKVVIRVGGGYSSGYFQSAGNVIEATGAPPSVLTSAFVAQYGTANTYWTSPTASKGGTWVPAPSNTGFNPSSTASVYGAKIKTNSTYLDVALRGSYFGVSVDGASPTYYATNSSYVRRIATDGLTHDYYIWGIGSAFNGSADMFAIGLDGAPLATTTPAKLHQYGDSITYGTGATSRAHTDVHRVAAALGMIGLNIGIAGQTSTTLVTNVVTQAGMANSNVATDVAVLAIGRNDGSFSSTNFDSIVATLLPYYKKILVRGILETPTDFSTFNNAAAAWVTGKADPKIVFIDPETWTGIATTDGTHLSDAGYATLAGYAVTAYTPHV